jgi:anion-transporting  ArsA/GET3 family ATPase
MDPAALFSKRLLMFSGKGGVGKSTVAAAFAVAAARRGQRVVIVEIGEHERISRIFGAPAAGYEGRVVYRPAAPGSPPIVSMCLTAREALREYGMRTMKFQLLYNAIFENPVVRYFTAAAPLMVDLNLLGKIDSLQREAIAPARGARFDLMVLDAPATGHALAMFEAPRAAMQMTQVGPVYAMVEPMWRLLTDPTRTALNVVCMPEEMPVNEAIELDARASALGIPRGVVVINARVPDAFPQGVDPLNRLTPRTPLEVAVVDAARSTVNRRAVQDTIARTITGAIPAPHIDLPIIVSPRIGTDEIERLADRIARELPHA